MADLAGAETIRSVDALLESIEQDRSPMPTFSDVILLLAEGFGLELAGRELPDFTGHARSLLVAGILRILAHRPAVLHESDRKVAAFKLLTDDLSDAVLRAADAKRNDQAYVFEERLRNAVLAADAELHKSLEDLPSLGALGPYRQAVMKALKAPVSLAAVSPFLPPSVTDVRLGSVFKAVESYRDAGADAVIGAREVAGQALDDLSTEALRWDTRHAREVLCLLSDKLKSSMDHHYEASSASKPADLEAGPSEKKYPLADPGRRFDAVLIVRNLGEGRAEDATIRVRDFTGNVDARSPEVYLGRLEATQSYVHIPCEVVTPDTVGIITGEIAWTNVDGTPGSNSFEVPLNAQRTDIDFESLAGEEPYSLEPVVSQEELVGRTEQLRQLTAMAERRQLGSCILYGQKRVGKTSLAKAMADQLRRKDDRMLVIYVEGGEYVNPDPRMTISNLGRRLCTEVRDFDDRLKHLEIPPFDGALAPVADYLRTASKLAPDLRVLTILDEFDELPIELYKPGGLGDAFFLTLRSLSGKDNLGFVLVGGEKIEYILSSQGHHLNKFQSLRIDYFDKEEHWPDFVELVRRPVAHALEVTDQALASLHAETAGNPFFTKLVCSVLYRMMVARRDNHITEDEVAIAASTVVRTEAVTSFQHFWQDGIIGAGAVIEDVSVRRRKVLLGIARILRRTETLTAESVVTECDALDLGERDVLEELQTFVRRQVLVQAGREYQCKVALFERWLLDRGVTELLTAALAADEVYRLREEEERLFVRSEEIVALVAAWGNYRGMRVTEERVRAWINQFDGDRERRLMFELLHGIRFYTHDNIRQKLAEAHGIVRRGFSYEIEERQRKRGEVLISYLDAVGKSGASYARLYAEENGVYFENIVEKGRLESAINKHPAAQALVFIDDFVGSGGTVSTALTELSHRVPHLFDGSGMAVYVIAVCGFTDGLKKAQKVAKQLDLKVSIRVCDPLTDADRCFSESSPLFSDPAGRRRAEEIATSYGRRLVKNAPLGFAGGQALAVFESSIPNNCPPILWKQTGAWKPLFARD